MEGGTERWESGFELEIWAGNGKKPKRVCSAVKISPRFERKPSEEPGLLSGANFGRR